MKSIEEKYKKLSQREHILHRPDTYIGSIQSYDSVEYVLEDGIFTKRNVKTNDGLLKIFDEIVSNAVDHVFRKQEVTKIKVTIDKTTGEISVYNDGKGIPVVIHKDHGIYVPELIFSHFLSGSNYDDNEDRSGAGRNGVGSKATAVFSKEFTVETVDENEGKKFTQTFKDNMKVIKKPKITSSKLKGYTKITFTPDYERFGLQHLTDDLYLMMEKRVYDCIASTSVSVYFNGVKIKANSFKDYVSFYSKSDPIAYEKASNGWEYAVFESPESFEQVSFVNGNNTTKGGKHVDYVINQITNGVKALVKGVNVGTKIKDSLFIILKADVINPSFSSQTKDTLTSTIKKFTVGDKFIKKIYQSDITKKAIEIANFKEMKKLDVGVSSSKKSKVKVAKLDDAYNAGTSKSSKCSLILTEGDSAKTFAVAGLSVIGRENYGVYALKGKCISEDTDVLMWDGRIKKANEVEIGDVLIGDDGTKRAVLTKFRAKGKMYEISQDRGDSYKVNDGHILTLCMPEHKSVYWYDEHSSWRTLYWDKNTNNIKVKEVQSSIKIKCNECGIMMNNQSLRRHYTRKHKNIKFEKSKTIVDLKDPKVIEALKKLEDFLSNIDDNNVIDVCIKDYLKISKTFQKNLKGIRGECVAWPDKKVLLEPYMLGIWLGDGSSSGYGYSCYWEKDPQIIEYLKVWGSNNDASFKNNKHIPRDYLNNSKTIRLQLLAGIIDTDGYVAPDGTIEISQTTKRKQLADDIVYLSRSLGFYTHLKKKITNYTYKNGEKAEAYIIKISGDTGEIPTILPRKKSLSTSQYNMRNSNGPIKIKQIEDDNYIGLGIDGNQRFLINDFTVTHNCLNVREATQQQLLKNEEIINLKQIMGLHTGKKYTDTKLLRYSSIILLTDADYDGAHISGLVINFIHHWWPELMEIPGFIRTIKTPIVKVSKGNQIQEFYNEFDYKEWITQVDDISKWNAKYYKGLGTSTSKESKEIFKNIKNNTRYYTSQDDKTTDKAIKLAFDKSKANDRKEWLRNVPEEYAIANSKQEITYDTFVNKELVHFSNYDNVRSIPSMVDGLKPSQRKVLYTAFKRNITKDIKVAQFGASVAEITAYHHGEVSLYGTIIGMAQNYTGAGNINLLEPVGMFGSRLSLGKDSASPRYIFTKLSQDAIKIFNPADSNILDYNEDDGNKIEPKFYTPSIPMVLVNGAIGIGTGYSTNIPHFNPDDIVKNIRLSLEDKPMETLVPWYRGFKGTITKQDDTCYIQQGCLNKINDLTLEITEIPTTTSIQSYLEFLEKNEDFETVNLSTEEEPKFILKFCSKDTLKKYAYSALKLTNKINLTNMYLFDENNTLKKYTDPNDIIKDFVKVKLEYLQRRKDYLQCKLTEELVMLKNKKRFLEEIMDGKVNVYRVKKSKAIEDLTSKNYTHIDQLLSIPVSSFTNEALVSLQNKIEDTESKYINIKGKTPKQLLLDDL